MPVIINYCNLRPRLRWFAWPTMLAGVMLAHFGVSVGIWAQWIVGLLRNPYLRSELFPSAWSSVPAIVLCSLSGLLFVLALRGRPVARRGVLLLVAAAVAFFLVDVCLDRWQIWVSTATVEYWNAGGRRHEYFTWWWYNDRWFE